MKATLEQTTKMSDHLDEVLDADLSGYVQNNTSECIGLELYVALLEAHYEFSPEQGTKLGLVAERAFHLWWIHRYIDERQFVRAAARARIFPKSWWDTQRKSLSITLPELEKSFVRPWDTLSATTDKRSHKLLKDLDSRAQKAIAGRSADSELDRLDADLAALAEIRVPLPDAAKEYLLKATHDYFHQPPDIEKLPPVVITCFRVVDEIPEELVALYVETNVSNSMWQLLTVSDQVERYLYELTKSGGPNGLIAEVRGYTAESVASRETLLRLPEFLVSADEIDSLTNKIDKALNRPRNRESGVMAYRRLLLEAVSAGYFSGLKGEAVIHEWLRRWDTKEFVTVNELDGMSETIRRQGFAAADFQTKKAGIPNLEAGKAFVEQGPSVLVSQLKDAKPTEEGLVNKEWLDIVDYWFSGPTEHDTVKPALTKRQKEVHEAATEGLDNNQIAAKLGISPVTVQNHLYAIRRQL